MRKDLIGLNENDKRIYGANEKRRKEINEMLEKIGNIHYLNLIHTVTETLVRGKEEKGNG